MKTFKEFVLSHSRNKKDKIPASILIPDYDDLKKGFIEKEKKKRHHRSKHHIEEEVTGSVHNPQDTKPLEKELHKRYNDFTPEEKKNIMNYSRNSFHINGHLLAAHHMNVSPESNPHFKKINRKYNIQTMDNLLTRKHLGRKMTVFSGAGFDPREQMSKSGHIHLPAYTSTSISPKAAFSFAKENKRAGEDKHMLRVELQHHDKGAYIGTPSGYIHEREFVLPRNTTLRIHKSERSKEDPSLWIHHAVVDHNVDHNKIEKDPNVIHGLNINFHKAFHSEASNSKISKALVDHHKKLVSNPNLDSKSLHDISDKSPSPEIHKMIINHPNVKSYTISKIAKKYDAIPFLKKDIHQHINNKLLQSSKI